MTVSASHYRKDSQKCKGGKISCLFDMGFCSLMTLHRGSHNTAQMARCFQPMTTTSYHHHHQMTILASHYRKDGQKCEGGKISCLFDLGCALWRPCKEVLTIPPKWPRFSNQWWQEATTTIIRWQFRLPITPRTVKNVKEAKCHVCLIWGCAFWQPCIEALTIPTK